MKGTKYTDLEKGETDQLTTKKINKEESKSKIEVCWWCMLICPIMIAITSCIFLVLIIIDQYKQKHAMEHEEEFNYIWIILSWIGLFVCGCPIICHTLKLIIGYICYPREKQIQVSHV